MTGKHKNKGWKFLALNLFLFCGMVWDILDEMENFMIC